MRQFIPADRINKRDKKYDYKHNISLNSSQCFISALKSYATPKFLYEISSWNIWKVKSL